MPEAKSENERITQRIEDRLLEMYGEIDEDRLTLAYLMTLREADQQLIFKQRAEIALLRQSVDQLETIRTMQATIIKGMEAEAGIYAHTAPDLRLLH